MKYGIEGYGLYFACVEIIAGNLTNENITFELEHDSEILSYKFKIDSARVEEMMKYMVNLKLFDINHINGRIICQKLASRIDSSLIKNKDLLKIKSKIQEESRSIEKKQEKSSQIRIDQNRSDNKRIDKEAEFVENSLLNFNNITGMKIKYSSSLSKKFNKLLKEYSKDIIFNTITNYAKSDWHQEQKAKNKQFKWALAKILDNINEFERWMPVEDPEIDKNRVAELLALQNETQEEADARFQRALEKSKLKGEKM